jgi:hypothetical protein
MRLRAAVQSAAKAVLKDLAPMIRADSTEASIAATAHTLLASRGYPKTWYHQCPALVLLGSRSCLSVSGKHYRPALEPVGDFNLVTVALSPCDGDVWGDCARSFCVENGSVTDEPTSNEFRTGLRTQHQLHQGRRILAAGRYELDVGKKFKVLLVVQ